MDCHAVQAPLAMTAAQTKSTRLSLSLACAIALGAMMIVPERAEADNLNFDGAGNFNMYGTCTTPCRFSRLRQTLDNNKGNVTFNNGYVGNVYHYGYDKQITVGECHLNNTTVGTANIGVNGMNSRFKVEFKTSGSSNNSTLTTINNRADRISLKAERSSSITVTTLNQYSSNNGDGRNGTELVITGGSHNRHSQPIGGSVYQRTNQVTHANITGGHYHQGYGPNGSSFGPSGQWWHNH